MHRATPILIALAVASCGTAPVESIASSVADAADQVKRPQLQQRAYQCELEQGVFAESVHVTPCESGYATLTVDGEIQKQRCDDGVGVDEEFQCIHRDPSGLMYFNDGPSHPSAVQMITGKISDDLDVGLWNPLFWAGAMNHDYCYHHNGTTRGLTQYACDQQFFSDLSAACANPAFAAEPWFSESMCRRHAAVMLATVRSFGGQAYSYINTWVDYPEWKPLWQVYGLPHDVQDNELSQQVEDLLDGSFFDL